MLKRWIGLFFLLLAAGASCGERHYLIGDNRDGAAGNAAAAGTESPGGGMGGAGSDDLGCPDACTHGCVGRLCEITPLADGSLPTCPAGFDCSVHCEEPGTCLGEVHCGEARTCVVSCSGEKNCSGAIHCDNTGDCQVVCSGTEACGSISCPTSGRCAVTCSGTNSCSSDIVCGAGPCSVLCGGAASCAAANGANGCEGSCACDWQCDQGSACQGNLPVCPAGCQSGLGCSSAAAGCRTCN